MHLKLNKHEMDQYVHEKMRHGLDRHIICSKTHSFWHLWPSKWL